jgi:hypothetical protein
MLTTVTWKGVLAASAAFAVGTLGLLASPSPAHAAGCNQWGFNGPLALEHTVGNWRVETNLMGARDSGPEQVLLVRGNDGRPAHEIGHTGIGEAFILPAYLGAGVQIEVH